MKYVRSFNFLRFCINLFTPANFTDHHENTKCIVGDGQIPEYFNIFSPVGRRENKYIANFIKSF